MWVHPTTVWVVGPFEAGLAVVGLAWLYGRVGYVWVVLIRA